MVDEPNIPVLQTSAGAALKPSGTVAVPEAGDGKRLRSTPSKDKLGSGGPSRTVSAKSKRHTNDERLAILKQIESRLADEKATLKDALAEVGISDPTYYQWKKAISVNSAPSSPTLRNNVNGFAEFDELDKENRRLRKLLAEKLQAENQELRRRLGLS